MRKICAVTSTRADYGIMSRLIELLRKSDKIDLKLIATGMHLSEKYGMTVEEIKIPIYEKVDIEIEKSPSESFSVAQDKFNRLFKSLKPDIVLLLGDRYEILAVAIAAMFNNIPLAHLYGGDTTEGAIDEAIRHSITKMSHLHFTSCEESEKRVVRLGENPKRVFNFGSLGVENIKKIPLLKKNELEKSLDFKFGEKNLLVTFHPVTLEGSAGMQFNELLSALDELENTNIIITCPNSDEGSDEISALIKGYEKTHTNVKAYKSLGLVRYLSVMQFVDGVVGNSSSGIYEVPSFKIPTVNIGNRQKGRGQSASIINCKPEKNDILRAIKTAYEKDFSGTMNIYEQDNTAEKIFEVLSNFDLNGIIKKEFYNF